MKKKAVYLMSLMLIIGCNHACDLCVNKNSKVSVQSKATSGTGNFRSFEFTYSIELEPAINKKLELWVPVPQNNSAQSISDIIIDTQGLSYELRDEDYHGNKYLYVYSDDGIKDSKLITLNFSVKREEHHNVKYDNISNDKYLKPSEMVPTGAMFKNIISDNNLNNQDMRSVYDFVLNGMHYGKPTDDKNSKNYKYIHGGKNPNTGHEWLPDDITYGLKNKTKDELVESQKKDEKYAYGNGNSLYACDIGVGNCTDYHSYFISVSRTMDVPARFHMGFPIPNGDEGSVGGYHCWADYYVDNEGWYPVDISEADKDPSRIDYFFGTVCENRVDMMIGRDFNLDGYEQNPVNLFIYPLLEINDKESNSFMKTFFYKNL